MQKIKQKKNLDLLADFPLERKVQLESIERFGIFDTMFYRTNDLIHAHRVSWLTRELMQVAKKFYKNLDGEKAVLLALVHDDAEVITGDYNASHKDFGSKAFKDRILKEEASAIKVLSKKYPKYAGKYNYEDLLNQAKDWHGIEGKIVLYADKLDALCESIHEVLAGNITFLPSVIFCTDKMSRFEQKYPEMKDFFNYLDSPLTNLRMIYLPSFSSDFYKKSFNKPHDKKSLKIKTVFHAYDVWRELTIKNWGQKGIDELTKQKEFFK